MLMVINVDKAKELGIFIASVREKSGYKSQRQLYLDSGISTATLSRIESGAQMPTPETLKTLSKFLKATTYEELLEKAGILHEANHLLNSENRDKHGNDLTDLYRSVERAFGDFENLPDDEKQFIKEEIDQMPDQLKWKLENYRKAKEKFLEQRKDK